MKKVYIAEPKLVAGTGSESSTLCYQVFEWEEGVPGLAHAPCSDEGRVAFLWGEGINDIRQRVIDNVLASFPGITSNDIIFLGGWA
jgi:hypothetical protein